MNDGGSITAEQNITAARTWLGRAYEAEKLVRLYPHSADVEIWRAAGQRARMVALDLTVYAHFQQKGEKP